MVCFLPSSTRCSRCCSYWGRFRFADSEELRHLSTESNAGLPLGSTLPASWMWCDHALRPSPCATALHMSAALTTARPSPALIADPLPSIFLFIGLSITQRTFYQSSGGPGLRMGVKVGRMSNSTVNACPSLCPGDLTCLMTHDLPILSILSVLAENVSLRKF